MRADALRNLSLGETVTVIPETTVATTTPSPTITAPPTTTTPTLGLGLSRDNPKMAELLGFTAPIMLTFIYIFYGDKCGTSLNNLESAIRPRLSSGFH